MRVAFLSDTQLGGGVRYGTPDRPRLDDQAVMLDKVTAIVDAQGVDTVVFCGDLFQHRRPGVDELLVAANWIDNLPVEVVFCAGNHDVRGPADRRTVLDLFGRRGETLFVTPGVRVLPAMDEGPDVALAFLPWSHPGPMRAAHEGATAVEQAEALLKVAEGLREEVSEHGAVEPDYPIAPILVTHYALSGMSLPTGLETGELVGEVVLDTQALLRQGWHAVVAGHVHKPQVVYNEVGEGVAISVGSPWVNDFGEAEDSHGFTVYDSDTDTMTFERLDDRPFVTIDLDGSEDLTDPEDLFGLTDLRDAVVRVRVRCTEQAARDIDLDRIRASLLEAGAHRVDSIALNVVRAIRLRADVGEDTQPLEALDSWLIVKSAPPREGERLRALTRDLLTIDEED